MIDKYTKKLLQDKTNSMLEHVGEVRALAKILADMDKDARDAVIKSKGKVSPGYHPYFISESTLLRIFGLKEKNYVTRIDKLNKLARFLGFGCYSEIMFRGREFARNKFGNNEFSGFDDEEILYSNCIQQGMEISFKYKEGREITMVYNGDDEFVIRKSIGSKSLQKDDILRINTIREGAQIDSVHINKNAPYTMGKVDGIFDLVVDKKPIREYIAYIHQKDENNVYNL